MPAKRTSTHERGALAEAIRALRLKLGDTQEEFARRLSLSVGTIAHYETGSLPAPKIVKRLTELAKSIGDPPIIETLEHYVPPTAKKSPTSIALLRTLFIFNANAPKAHAEAYKFLAKCLRRAFSEAGKEIGQDLIEYLELDPQSKSQKAQTNSGAAPQTRIGTDKTAKRPPKT